MRRSCLVAGTAVLAALACAGAAVARYACVTLPERERRLGALEVAEMRLRSDHSVAGESESERAEAGRNLMRALNRFNARRRPYLLRRRLNPNAQEPPVLDSEIALIERACDTGDADLYADPDAEFVTSPSSKPWPMRPAIDPTELRPYVAPLRALAQGALNNGKAIERNSRRSNRFARAAQTYESVRRLGRALRRHPGAFVDIDLGLEIETRALHYLIVLSRKSRDRALLDRAQRLERETLALQERVRSKYALLDDPDAARKILLRDVEPVWRIEAAFALVTAVNLGHLGYFDSWTARRALVRARDADPSLTVRAAAARMLATKPEAFREPSAQSGQGAGRE